MLFGLYPLTQAAVIDLVLCIKGRKKIDGSGLEEEIHDLEEMLEELQMDKDGGRPSCRQLQRCKGRNFDRQASTLRRRLERMPVNEVNSIKDIREIALPVLHRQEKAPPDEEIDRVVAETDDQVQMFRYLMHSIIYTSLSIISHYTVVN